jgi:uncharacterized membrane protein
VQQSSQKRAWQNFPGLPLKLDTLSWLVLLSSVIFFACSSVRHLLFQSGAFDLGIFDQALYLISQGRSPVPSLIGFHILGDHAAWILYPLALLYKIYPSVYWLFAVQAVALAVGAIPVYQLARQAELQKNWAIVLAGVYLLYPLVFNVNIFDFHPEVIALPALLWAVFTARQGKIGWFGLSLAIVLGCKAVLSLTVAALGVWLVVFEKKRLYGAIALFAGIIWFLLASQVIIPTFRPGGVEAVARYSYLGNSVLEIAQNVILKPGLILGQIFSLGTLEYLVLLALPLLWGFSGRSLSCLIPALPTLIINILSTSASQRNLVQQYSLPILPFLMVMAIASLAEQRVWLKKKWAIVLWSVITFLVLAKYGYFGSKYLETLATWQATNTAIHQIQTEGGVLTTHDIAPHLSHRSLVKFTDATKPLPNLSEFDYVLLNVRHPGWQSNPTFAQSLVSQLQQTPQFQLQYEQDQVYLFTKLRSTSAKLTKTED